MSDLFLVWIAVGVVSAAHAVVDWLRARRHESAMHLDERMLADLGLRRGRRISARRAHPNA